MLLAHLQDLAGRAAKTGCEASRFLTPAQSQSACEYFKRGWATLSFEGGFEGAERTRAVFVNSDWGGYDREKLLSALKIRYRPQDSLSHRDVLGSLMALGIERDVVGDIVCEDGTAALICLPEMEGYIAENLDKVGRVGVTVSKIAFCELPAKQENLIIKTDTVASLRLDVVLCAAFDLPRTKASELIAAGRVSLKHQLCLQPAKELDEGALLSVRGLGRAKLLEVGGLSKKGRMFVQIGLYER